MNLLLKAKDYEEEARYSVVDKKLYFGPPSVYSMTSLSFSQLVKTLKDNSWQGIYILEP